MRNPIGSCKSRCHGKVLPNQGPCNGFGCCSISLQNDITGFQGTIVRAGNMAAQSDPRHPGIMAFMSIEDHYMVNATHLFSSWTNASKIDDAALEVAIMDQPSCKIAQMNKASYACATGSYCRDESYGGYSCHCYNGYSTANAYLSEGCMQGAPCLLFSKKKKIFNILSSCSYSYQSIVMKQITTPSLNNTAGGHVGTCPFPSLSGLKKIVSETKGSDLIVPLQMRRFLAQHIHSIT